MFEGLFILVLYWWPWVLTALALSAAFMIGYSHFRRRLPGRVDQRSVPAQYGAEEVRQQLSDAITLRRSDLVEHTLSAASASQVEFSSYFDLACQLLTEDWHISHEDLIGRFQDAEDPQAVPYLRQAIELKARLKYLDYDDYGAYYKRCLWALTAIGTPEAMAVIKKYANSDIEALREQARYRLTEISA